MTNSQYKLLLAIRDAMRAQPKEPYTDYENGCITRDQFYERKWEYELVQEIRGLMSNDF